MTATLPRLREKACILLFTALLLSLAAGAPSSGEPCRNADEICAYSGTSGMSNDPWYGLVTIDRFGKYVGSPNDTKAYNLRGEEVPAMVPGVSPASCFITQIKVRNDGSYACKNEASGTWAAANCARKIIGGVGLALRSEAYNGRYTILGEPTKKFPESINPATMSADDVNDIYNRTGKYIVVDADYTIIGVDEEKYVKEMWRQQQRRSGKNYESATFELTYTIARTCDLIGVLNDTRNCKRRRIFDKRYDIIGSSEEKVYQQNIDLMDFEKCVWLIVDYGKFYKYPGVMLVLLNRSKFGTHKGFNFNAIVEQETQYANHVYRESVFAGSYPGAHFGAEECCKYESSGANFSKCVPYGTCVSYGACMWSSTPTGGCWPVANSLCANECEVAATHEIKQSVYTWNSIAADRLIGCDKCMPGDNTCSMGASIANARRRYPTIFPNPVSDWPPEFRESWEKCGYYNPWNLNHWVRTGTLSVDCNCLTGWRGKKARGWFVSTTWMCDERECNECAKRGYGCQWETGGTNGCYNCYDPVPSGKPDQNLVRKSFESINTRVDMVYTLSSNAKGVPICGHNPNHDGVEWWTWQLEGPWGADNRHCSDGSGVGGEVGCAKEDCMYPWNQSAASIGDLNQDKFTSYQYMVLARRQRQGWDLANRGGAVDFSEYWTGSRLGYSDYLSKVDPKKCSDWMGENPEVDPGASRDNPPWFWGDKYSICTFDKLETDAKFSCNCTRQEHEPKKHTPCDCPASGQEVAFPGNFDSCPSTKCWYEDIEYYRLFNRDTVWSSIFKVTPEVSNATIRYCTEKVNCNDAYRHFRSVLPIIYPGLTSEQTCNNFSSSLVCSGCYFDGSACKNCVSPANTVNITECGDYPTDDACNKNGCKLEVACYWKENTGDCRQCPPKGSNTCSIYRTVEQCALNPCGFSSGCGWDKAAPICRNAGIAEKNCTQLCGASGSNCDKTECRLASVISKEKCTYDTIGFMGSPGTIDPNCVSCGMDKFKGAKCLVYGTKESCKDDLCGFGCFWWKDPGGTNEQCKNCEAIQSVGCGEYTIPETCNKNTCGVAGGCALNTMNKCRSCAFIDSCDKYGKDSCFRNPCRVAGGCGWNASGECLPAGSLAECINTPSLKECIEDISTLTDGGCWFGIGITYCDEMGGCAVSGGCINCNGKTGYPVESCNDYRTWGIKRGFMDSAKGACLRDDCEVGPCAWFEKGGEIKCIKAFTVKPGEGHGWIRSGGTAGDAGENIGGGEFYTHAGGGINIPNQSESEGFKYTEMYWRNGSIWSEVIDEDTLLVLENYRTESERMGKPGAIKHNTPSGYLYPNCGWQNLMACDANTMTCGNWTNRQPTEGTYIRTDEWKHYVESLKKRIPVSLNASGKTPPKVCGTLCAKKVIEWPRYNPYTYDQLLDISYYFWNMTHGGVMNLTLNETAIGSKKSELTRWELFSKNAEIRLDSKLGNVLPMPSHPYTHLNWFNMPEYQGDWKLQDDTANISLRGNYTFNVTLHRDPLAMQCLWDGCLHHTGKKPTDGWMGRGVCTKDHYRYICDASNLRPSFLGLVPECNPGAGLQQIPCSVLTAGNSHDLPRGKHNITPNACIYPYYDAYLKCMGYTSVAYGDVAKGCWNSAGCCICADAQYNSTGSFIGWRSNFVWQARCIACWTHDRCDYPLVNETKKKQFIEEINDSSSVLTDKYGENFSIERPLKGPNPTDNLTINISGYVDYDGFDLDGYIKVIPAPDILNGFNIIFPEKFIIEYNSKSYPAEHELYRTQMTTDKDECIHSHIPGDFPGDESMIWCSDDYGNRYHVDCEDYGHYFNLKPPGVKEFESQTKICFDKRTKQFLNAVYPIREPERPYFILANNPLKKYYHYTDLFLATDKNYSWETVLYGIGAGVFWFDKIYWVDTSMALGVIKNYHEDEENYYDLAALFPNPQVTKGKYPNLYRNYTVTNVHEIRLNKYVNVDSTAQYDKEQGAYYLYFKSKSINADVARNAIIRFFTHYRSFNTSLMGSASPAPPSSPTGPTKYAAPGGPISNRVAPRIPVTLEILVSNVNITNITAFTDVNITVTMSPIPDSDVDPNASIFLSIGPPYLKEAILSPGGSYTFRIEKSPTTVKAKYLGSWSEEKNKGYAKAEEQLALSPKYTSAVNWILGNILLLAIAFAVIVSYRFFMDKRMDYYTMLQESGIYEMFKDFFGFK